MNITIDDLLNYVKIYNIKEIEELFNKDRVIVLTDILIEANTGYIKKKIKKGGV